jgi:hypothetical protein
MKTDYVEKIDTVCQSHLAFGSCSSFEKSVWVLLAAENIIEIVVYSIHI